MFWLNALKQKIDALKDHEWDFELIALPNGKAIKVKITTIRIEMPAQLAWDFQPNLGNINSTEVAGISPGKLIIAAIGTTGDVGTVDFGLRNSIPWNRFVDDRGKFVEVVSVGDQSPYDSADFNRLPAPHATASSSTPLS